MKKITKRFLASLMVAVMVLSSAPLSGIAMLDWASVFATISSALSKSEEPVNASSDMACDFIQYVDIDNKDTELKHSRLNVASSRPPRMLAANKNSDNPNTYTVLLLDKEASHNLTSGGTYICTLGSPVENVKAAALKLIDQIRLTRGTTHVAIVTFDSSVQVVQNFTTDYTTMRNSIDKISSGSTWANVNGAYQKADELLSAVTDNSADKNIVLFSQGLAYAGDHTTNGIYSEEDCNWYRTDTNIHAYEYSNSAYATAQSLMSKYNIYSIGLYQSFDTVPEAGQSLLSFALSFAEDVQNSGFYSINDINDLEFNLAEDVFNLAVAIDPDKIIIPVRAIDSSGQYVNAVGAKVTVYNGTNDIITDTVKDDGCVAFSKSELYSKGLNEKTLNKCTVSAHWNIGEIELCSEYVNPKGIWEGGYLLSTSILKVTEPRMNIGLDIGFVGKDDKEKNKRYNKIKKVVEKYSKNLAEMTNGHCLLSNVTIKAFDSDLALNNDGVLHDVYIFDDPKNTVGLTDLDSAATYTLKTGGKIIVFDYNNGYFEDKVLTHESGHFFFGLLDEYISGSGKGANGGEKWKNKPVDPYGVMDDEWDTIELSTSDTYSYLNAQNINDPDMLTAHYSKYKESTEETFANFLLNKSNGYGSYTFSNGKHKVKYSYSKITVDGYQSSSYYSDEEISQALKELPTAKSLINSLDFGKNTNTASLKVRCDETISDIFLDDGNIVTRLLIENGVCEVSNISSNFDLIAIVNEESKNIYHCIYDKGFLIINTDINNVLNDYSNASNLFCVIDLQNDREYNLNQSINCFDNYNYQSISWFEIKNGTTFPIETELEIQTGNTFLGERKYSCIVPNMKKYILLAKTAECKSEEDISDFSVMIDPSENGNISVSFKDATNEDSLYILYYSSDDIRSAIDNKTADYSLSNDSSFSIPINELGTYEFALLVKRNNGNYFWCYDLPNYKYKFIDSDNDGIPDNWFDDYPQLLELEDIPRSDPDDDGLDNLTEYQYGTNPLCPDTDGDNVYDKIELLKKLDPLNPKTDGETDDYIVAYGTPELKITNLHFDERYVYFSVENDTDSKAMRTVVDVRSGDSSIALWTVDIDSKSVIDFAVEKGMLSGLEEFTISVDEGMITRDSDYSNNTFNYSASTLITLNDIDVVKNTAENLVPVISPETANEIYRYTLIDGSCITLDEINGSIFADKIGQAHIQVESLSGNADTCLVSVISFEGAEYSEFECLKINETEVAITGYYGESTSVEIPESIGEFTVTAINSRAFNNIDVESVSIPDSVSEISETAFYVNHTINSFIVDENNPAYCSDGGVIYNKDKTTLVAYPPAKAAETFDIPDTVTCIGSYAFNYNTFLTSISINNGISEIGSYAFYQCSSLNAINIDRSVTNIGTYAFYGCTNLSEAAYSGDINDWCKITFSSMYSNPSYYTNGIKINGQPILGEIEISSNVGAYSLYNFTDITKVTVSDGVETIGKYAFRNCSNLKDVIISNSVSSIQNGAFRDCNKIENMSIPFVGESRTAIEMNSVFGYIFDYVLFGTGTVRQYYSGSILGYGYYIPSSIKTVTITDATKIPYGAFYNCSSITDIIINDSVTNMGEKCFANCNGLVNLTIPFVGESRTATGINGVFGYFFNSSDTSDDNTVTQYYESSGSKYYYIPTSIESITITDAEQLPYGAFYNCSMLKNISLNQKITDIGSSAFSGCSSLENTYYTGTIESWCTTNFMSSSSCPNYYAKHFYLNGELLTGELIIPDSVTDISSYSFYNFKDLESIKFSNTLQSVGTSTFYGCSGLKKVEYEGTIDDWYGLSFDNYASNPNYYAQNLLISGEPVEGRIVMPDGLEKVPNVVFAGCKDITEVVISESATSIGKSAFDRCSGLENIVIPENVTLIDQNAFCDCSSLKNLIVPCSVKYSSNGFKNCNNIEEITITKGDGTMPNLISLSLLSNYYGYTPWYTSNSIERIVIEDGVEIIGNYEFRSTSASEIIIPDSVKSIGTYAFYDNSNLNKLTVPNSVETISSKAFSSNTVIYCYNNSAAHLYAKENSLNYILLDCIYAIEGSLLTIDNDLKLISGFVNGIDALYSELNVSEGSTIFFDKSVEKVYTGMPIQVLDKNGNILSDYAAVIIGDVTGDGNYDGMDSIIVSSIVNGMLTKTDVGEAVYMAADCNRDGQITQSDVDLLTYAGVYEYDVSQVSSEKSQKADVLFANEFDFDSFGFSYSCYGGQIEDIDYENNSVIIKSESNDCYMNPWYGADNSMNLIPGHKYRIKYTAENLSDSLAIPSVLLFARNSEDSTDIDNIEYMFTELDAGQKTVFEDYYIVPEGCPFVKVRLGNNAASTVRISGIIIQDVTNLYNNEDVIALPSDDGKECSTLTINKGIAYSDYCSSLPMINASECYLEGWYTEKDSNGNGTGERFNCDKAIKSNIKLYPRWERNPTITFDNEFDFSNYLFDSVSRGNLIVSNFDSSVEISSTGYDCYTIPYNITSQPGFMLLEPGKTYRFTYNYENKSDSSNTISLLIFAFQNVTSDDYEFKYLYSNIEANECGEKTIIYTVPEDRPYTTIRFGVSNENTIVKFSDLYVQNITNSDGIADDINEPIHMISVPYDKTITEAESITSLPVLSRTGYEFMGWYTGKNGTGTRFTDSTVVTESVRLYSYWVK